MAVDPAYQSDVEAILSHRYDNGADFWTTPDKRLLKGSPFSAYNSAQLLLELGMEPSDPILMAVAELFFSVWREDGRFKLYPSGGILPCHTALAACLLCRMGYAEDPRVKRTLEHLLESQYQDGGWRCNKFSYGRGPETEYSNPLPTLMALAAFRFSETLNREPALDRAVDFLLGHWVIRKPIGPCHYGIGTLFMQVAYPFGDYNLFLYVHTLSFYARARADARFQEALAALRSKLVDGQIVVERVVPKLAKLAFCRKNAPSELATRRYHEILTNMEGGHAESC
ncbi:prenyltransferase [Eubacteriales bacterium OttesenSCG-928-A19]|nr:prenyltransferase [Eubacteriales bacterium OttesenSCG-928-A19]